MKRLLKNDQGYTMLLVLFTFVLLSVITFSLFTMSSNSLKTSTNERADQSLYYIAEAGVVERYDEIEQIVSSTFEEVNKDYEGKTSAQKETYNFEDKYFERLEAKIVNSSKEVTDFESMFSEGQPIAKVTVGEGKYDEENKTMNYTITSVASINNDKNNKRTVEKTFTVSLDFSEEKRTYIPEFAGIIAHSGVTTENGYIYGDVIYQTETCEKMLIKSDTKFFNKVKIPEKCKNSGSPFIATDPEWFNRYSVEVDYNMDFYEFPMPDFPIFPTGYPLIPDREAIKNQYEKHKVIDNGNININSYLVSDYTLELDKNYKINNINLASSNKLTLDIGNRNISLLVNSINGSGHIFVKGTGTLTIYVNNNISLDGNFNYNKDKQTTGAKVNIYVAPSSPVKTIKVSGDYGFAANLYAANSNILVEAGSKFLGNIVTSGEKVNFSGAALGIAQGYTVYAPNAEVTLSGSATINGSVISKKFNISGGATVDARVKKSDDNPFLGNTSNSTKKTYNRPIVTSRPTKEIK